MMRTMVLLVWMLSMLGACAAPPHMIPTAAGQGRNTPQRAEARLDGGSTSAQGWHFEHVVVDADPPAGYRINDIQIGDIDGDGLPDIWISGRGKSSEAYQMVWYQNPGWTRHGIAPGDFKYGALGDLDGDGDLDVVAGRADDASVRWFENPGKPGQQDWPDHDLGIEGDPDLFHVGDVDGDGRLDVVCTFKNELGWAKNPTDPQTPWPVHVLWSGATRTGGTLADLDRDGDLDVLYGNGWFENPLPHADPAGPWPLRVIDADWPTEARGAVGDLDGDGRPDVVLSGEESESGVVWYAAPADPKTERWMRRDIVRSGYEGVHSLALADFDRDGDLDVFAAEMHHGADPDKVAIFENVVAAADLWAEHILDTTGSHNARIGDLNGDGCLDIAGKNYQAGDLPLRVDAWINRCGAPDLPIDRWQRHIVDGDRPWRAVFIDGGDVNGDGLPDIVTGGWWYQNPGQAGDPWVRHTIGGELHNMAAVYDFDGDGDLDVLGTKGQVDSDEFVWAENDGRGAFELHTNLPRADGDFLQGARVAEMLPAGNLVVVLSWHNRTSTQMLQVPSPATDPWLWQAISPATNGEQIAIGDLDGDGDPDIHLGTQWLRNDGEEGWMAVPAFVMGDLNAEPDRVELADVNGDGRLDVVIGAEHARRVVWAEAPSDPDQPWMEHLIAADMLAQSLDVADVDRDGDLDVVVGEHTPDDPAVGRVILYHNQDGGRAWIPHVIDWGLEHHDGTRFIDIDNDGDFDILSIGWTHNRVVLYENRANE